MFVVHRAGEKPEVGALAEDLKIIFFGLMAGGEYCLITAPKTVSLVLEKGKTIDLSGIGLTGHIGKKSDFTSIPITRGCLISDRCFANGEKFFFSYHGQELQNRKYCLPDREFEEIFVHFK